MLQVSFVPSCCIWKSLLQKMNILRTPPFGNEVAHNRWIRQLWKMNILRTPPFGNDVAHNRCILQLWKTFLGMFCLQIILICPQLLDFDSCSSYHETPVHVSWKCLIWKELNDMVKLLLETCFDNFPSWSKSFLWNTASTCILGLSEKL